MAVIAIDVGTYNPRADVLALKKIDEGTIVEQEEFGATATTTSQGAAEYMWFWLKRRNPWLHRRTRPTFVSIELAPDWPTAHAKLPDEPDSD
jgi:hypothetical protein